MENKNKDIETFYNEYCKMNKDEQYLIALMFCTHNISKVMFESLTFPLFKSTIEFFKEMKSTLKPTK